MSFTITITDEMARLLKKHCENQKSCKHCIFSWTERCRLENEESEVPCNWNV